MSKPADGHRGGPPEPRPLSARIRSFADRPVLPAVAALVAVVALDLVAGAASWGVPVTALLDEPAHLLTAWLLLRALLPERYAALWPWALVGAVAIDVDHVPLYLWHVGTATGSGRPVTHSLATVLGLLVLAAARSRLRVPLLGLAVGLGTHLVRDLATGPGVPLLWPLQPTSVVVPYVVYLGVLVLVVVASGCRRSQRREASASARGNDIR